MGWPYEVHVAMCVVAQLMRFGSVAHLASQHLGTEYLHFWFGQSHDVAAPAKHFFCHAFDFSREAPTLSITCQGCVGTAFEAPRTVCDPPNFPAAGRGESFKLDRIACGASDAASDGGIRFRLACPRPLLGKPF